MDTQDEAPIHPKRAPRLPKSSYYPILASDRLHLILRYLGVGPKEFAESCGIHRTQMTRLLSGERRPTTTSLESMLSGLNVRLKEENGHHVTRGFLTGHAEMPDWLLAWHREEGATPPTSS